MKAKPDQPASTPSLYDVIISGGGPVGLFLAAELALAGCSVLILEKSADAPSPLKQLPFGMRGLSAPTIESLDRRGLLGELKLHERLKNPHVTAAPEGPRRPVGHFAGISFLEGDVDASQWKYRLPSSTATSLMTTMEEIETVLLRRAESLGVTIAHGLAVTGFQQAADGVIVHAGEMDFHGKWLVGCDGSRSLIRKAGGFSFEGTEPEFTGYTAQVEIADPEKLKPGRNLTPNGMYLQSQPGYLILQDFDGGAFHQAEKPVTAEHLQEVLRRVSGTDVTLRSVFVATTWTDRARQATAYRNGRVLLAGDAAHIHSPLGGQGLNLGLGDAMNLGWKLAATIHGKALAGLLDSYHEERYPIGAEVLNWSRAQVAVMRPDPAARALQAIVRDLIGTRDGATYFAGRVRGVNMQYDLGGGHPLVGRSVPNFEFEEGVTLGNLLREGKGLLLDFGEDAALRALADDYGIGYISRQPKEQAGFLVALIRPDGIVAWAASDADPDLDDLDGEAGRWFLRNR